MVRPTGCGCGGDNPPPPEYMAGLIQQFDVESPVHGTSHGSVPSSPYESATRPSDSARLTRLNPVIYHNSTHPLDADDWLRDITFELEFADVAPANYVTFAAY